MAVIAPHLESTGLCPQHPVTLSPLLHDTSVPLIYLKVDLLNICLIEQNWLFGNDKSNLSFLLVGATWCIMRNVTLLMNYDFLDFRVSPKL